MENHQPSPLPWSLAVLQKVGSKRDMDLALAKIRDRFRFAHLTFLVVRSANRTDSYPFCSTTYPEEWTSLYLRNNYFEIDPVIELSHTGFLMLDWSKLDRRSSGVRDFFAQANAFNIGRHGATLPIRGPGGERSLFSATSNLPRLEWRQLRIASNHNIQILSHYLHEKVLSLTELRESSNYRTLSRREQECLQLLAQGLVPKRIAPRLHISESAVRLYLGSARRKLNAATIYQAIGRASFLELIRT